MAPVSSGLFGSTREEKLVTLRPLRLDQVLVEVPLPGRSTGGLGRAPGRTGGRAAHRPRACPSSGTARRRSDGRNRRSFSVPGSCWPKLFGREADHHQALGRELRVELLEPVVLAGEAAVAGVSTTSTTLPWYWHRGCGDLSWSLEKVWLSSGAQAASAGSVMVERANERRRRRPGSLAMAVCGRGGGGDHGGIGEWEHALLRALPPRLVRRPGSRWTSSRKHLTLDPRRLLARSPDGLPPRRSRRRDAAPIPIAIVEARHRHRQGHLAHLGAPLQRVPQRVRDAGTANGNHLGGRRWKKLRTLKRLMDGDMRPGKLIALPLESCASWRRRCRRAAVRATSRRWSTASSTWCGTSSAANCASICSGC
jgi:hypothetical protein